MQKYKMNVSVVIPNLNGKGLLEKNLPFVEKAYKNKKNNIVEVIIVDDASVDDSVKFVKKKYNLFKIIKHTKNKGFSAAVNTGVRMAKGDLVVLLNSDVSPNVDFVEKTLADFFDDKVFAVSFNEKKYSWARAEFRDGCLHHEPGSMSSKTHISFWANGGSSIVRRDLWLKFGGMDEDLFSPFYWEDVDLSYRAQKRGYLVLWEPKAIVDHKHESTIGKLPKRYTLKIRERNELFFIWKNITSRILFKRHFVGLVKRVVVHPGYLKIVFIALLKLPKIFTARRKESKQSKVSDEAIFARFQTNE